MHFYFNDESNSRIGRCYLAKCQPEGDGAYTYLQVVTALAAEHHTCFTVR